MNNITEKDKKRFWNKVSKGGKDECWEWTAGKRHGGYGQFKLNNKMQVAHRLSWMWANNKDVPVGMLICHHCDNPSCVNPDHLFLGTNADNNRDCWSKGRNSNKGIDHSQSKFTEEQIILIKRHIAEADFEYGDKTAFCKFWAPKIGVSWQAISGVLYNNRWSHISLPTKGGVNV